MRPPTKVILVGQMGAGKSTVARLVAERRPGFAAVDLDALVEARAGAPIAEIFRTRGEPAFRALEAEVLAELLTSAEPLVIATGGGAPCQPGAIERMRAAGVVIWLCAPPEVLAARALGDTRPLLSGLDHAGAARYLASQLEVRRPFYEQAQLVIDAALSPDDVASAIDRALADLIHPSA